MPHEDPKLTLTWEGAQEPGLQGYNVHRSLTPDGTFEKKNTSLLTEPSFDDYDVLSGVKYYYKVEFVFSSSSMFSEVISASVTFSWWYFGAVKLDGVTMMNKTRSRLQSKRRVLGKAKPVVQDRGFAGEEMSLELYLLDDDHSSGQDKYDQFLAELSKTSPITLRDPFNRTWKVTPGDWRDDQLLTGKLEYKIKIDLTEVD